MAMPTDKPWRYNKDKCQHLINPTSLIALALCSMQPLSSHCSAFVSPRSQPALKLIGSIT